MLVQVTSHDGHYHLHFEVVVAAPPARVIALITNYNHLRRLSPDIVSSAIIPGPGNLKVRMVMRTCVAWFCKTVHKTEYVFMGAHGQITTQAIPAESDFRYQWERWHIRASKHGGTRISYHSGLAPGFFVPPLIGPWLIRRTIRHDLAVSVRRLSRLAR